MKENMRRMKMVQEILSYISDKTEQILRYKSGSSFSYFSGKKMVKKLLSDKKYNPRKTHSKDSEAVGAH